MTTRLRRATLATIGVAVLALAACGVSSSDASSDTTAPGAPTTVTAPGVPDTTDAPSGTTEPGSTSDTTEPGGTAGTLPSGVDEKQLRDSFASGFEAAGLSKKQAECLADAYIDKVGIGTDASPDYSQILDLFGECDIDPSDLGGAAPGT